MILLKLLKLFSNLCNVPFFVVSRIREQRRKQYTICSFHKPIHVMVTELMF